MKSIYALIFAFVFCIITSCNSPRDGKVIRYLYSDHPMLLLADTAVLSVQESSDSINFIYDYSGRLTLFKNDPSVIVYDGLKCFIIDSARVKIARENRMIRKYYYDKPSTHDEERSIFILEDYGLILEVGEAWGQYLVFERIEQDGLEIRQKILEDSNGFFKFPKK